jgi:hypothetical protein
MRNCFPLKDADAATINISAEDQRWLRTLREVKRPMMTMNKGWRVEGETIARSLSA